MRYEFAAPSRRATLDSFPRRSSRPRRPGFLGFLPEQGPLEPPQPRGRVRFQAHLRPSLLDEAIRLGEAPLVPAHEVGDGEIAVGVSFQLLGELEDILGQIIADLVNEGLALLNRPFLLADLSSGLLLLCWCAYLLVCYRLLDCLLAGCLLFACLLLCLLA